MTRRQTVNANTEDAPQGESAPPVIPAGVAADVTVKYKTQVDPNQSANERDDLDDLVALANEGEDLPPDEISAFCHQWQNFAGQLLSVVRLPDPPERRLAGNAYARPCFNMERLGDTTFDPNNLIGTLQFINNNSGGVFRIWLTYQGQPVPGARLERVAIGDPVGAHAPNANTSPPLLQQQQPPPPPQKSAAEIELEQVKNNLFSKALERALNPPTPAPASANGTPQLPPEQQATLFLLGNTEFMPNIFKQMTALAQQAAGVDKEPSIKERALDAATEILKSNPAVINRLTDVADRIIGRVFGHDPRYDAPAQQIPPGYYQQAPYTPPPAYQPTPPPSSNAAPTQAANVEPLDMDPDFIMNNIIDPLLAMINSAEPLSLQHPVIVELEKRYPRQVKFAVKMIIQYPLENIIDWIKNTGGNAYVIMLDGPASGPFLRQRLAELQQLFIEGKRQYDEQQASKRAAQSRQPTTQPAPPPEEPAS